MTYALETVKVIFNFDQTTGGLSVFLSASFTHIKEDIKYCL